MPSKRGARKVSGRYWATYIREMILPEFDTYEECVARRILRSFDSLKAEVNDKADKLLSSAHVTGDDYDATAEWAWDKANEWGLRVYNIRLGTVALMTAGLFHLFEQSTSWLYREATRAMFDRDPGQGKQVNVEQFTAWFRKQGIEVEKFERWKTISTELRAVANASKHAEGDAATTLRTLRPDLFVYPTFRGTPMDRVGTRSAIRRPIAGEGLYITDDEFKSYAGAVREFWAWLAERLDES